MTSQAAILPTRAFVNGIGWVTAAGLGRGRVNAALDLTAGPLPVLKRRLLFAEADTRFGRLDAYSRLGLAAIVMALRDAGLPEDGRKRPVAVIASTVHGCATTDLAYLDTMLPQAGALASPNLFAYTLPNCFLGEAAIRFGFTGACFILQEQSVGGRASLQFAMDLLTDGEATTVLAGVCDLTRSLPGGPGPEVPGAALFLVLDAVPHPGLPPYAELRRDRQGAVRLAAHVVTDLFGLAQHCLPGKT